MPLNLNTFYSRRLHSVVKEKNDLDNYAEKIKNFGDYCDLSFTSGK